MLNAHRKRITLLVAAGILFGATTCGWLQRLTRQPATISWHKASKTNHDKTTAAQSGNNAAAQSALAESSRPARAAAADAPSGSPAAAWTGTAVPKSDNAFKAAKQILAANQNLHDMVLPPPPAAACLPPAGDTAALMPPPPALPLPPAKHACLSEGISLVGLVDGKAIFVVQRAYASDHNMPAVFSLGVGQQFQGIKVQSVSNKSATISDGKSVCVKDIGPIN